VSRKIDHQSKTFHCVQVIGKSFGADDNLDWLTDEVAKHPAWNTSKSPMILALWHKKTSPQLEKLEEMGVEVSCQPSNLPLQMKSRLLYCIYLCRDRLNPLEEKKTAPKSLLGVRLSIRCSNDEREGKQNARHRHERSSRKVWPKPCFWTGHVFGYDVLWILPLSTSPRLQKLR
jgi:hypothetical protein